MDSVPLPATQPLADSIDAEILMGVKTETEPEKEPEKEKEKEKEAVTHPWFSTSTSSTITSYQHDGITTYQGVGGVVSYTPSTGTWFLAPNKEYEVYQIKRGVPSLALETTISKLSPSCGFAKLEGSIEFTPIGRVTFDGSMVDEKTRLFYKDLAAANQAAAANGTAQLIASLKNPGVLPVIPKTMQPMNEAAQQAMRERMIPPGRHNTVAFTLLNGSGIEYWITPVNTDAKVAVELLTTIQDLAGLRRPKDPKDPSDPRKRAREE